THKRGAAICALMSTRPSLVFALGERFLEGAHALGGAQGAGSPAVASPACTAQPRQRRRWPSSHRARPFSASSGRKSFSRPVARAARFLRRACLRSKYQPAVPSSRRSSLPQSLPFIPNVEICCVCQSTSVIARSIACVAWEYPLLFGLASQV